MRTRRWSAAVNEETLLLYIGSNASLLCFCVINWNWCLGIVYKLEGHEMWALGDLNSNFWIGMKGSVLSAAFATYLLIGVTRTTKSNHQEQNILICNCCMVAERRVWNLKWVKLMEFFVVTWSRYNRSNPPISSSPSSQDHNESKLNCGASC